METTSLAASVLVAEDQPEVQHALQLLLKMAGHRVELASSPDEAMAAVHREVFDLLLVDLNYHRDTTSGDEGLKLLEDLRTLRYESPVVAMTAWGSIDLAVEAMHRGACDFVQKPWDNDHLLRIVNKHVESGRTQRRNRRRQQLEMQDAVAVQRRLLPRDLPSFPGLSIAGECRPAGDMGGDYFDVFSMGKKLGICIADVIGHLQKSPQWEHMLVVVTYDENGGFWDHVAPPKADRWGPGSRIPTLIVSPYAKKGFVDHTLYDTTSILRFVTERFELPVLPGLIARDAALKANGHPAMGDLTNALALN